MSVNAKLKYIFLGNLSAKKELGDYPSKSAEQHAIEGKQIFSQLCKSEYKKFEERQKIDSTNGHFYFTTSLNGVFYLAFADTSYPDRQIFELFDQLQEQGLNLMLDDKGELSGPAKDKLRDYFKKYNDSTNVNNISKASIEMEGVRVQMKDNIKNLLSNNDDLNELDKKGQKLKEGSIIYQKDAKELESVTWWKNCKLTAILIFIIIVVILAIVIPLVLSAKGSSSLVSGGGSSNSTNSTSSKF